MFDHQFLTSAHIGVSRVKTAVTRRPSPKTHFPPYFSAQRPPGILKHENTTFHINKCGKSSVFHLRRDVPVVECAQDDPLLLSVPVKVARIVLDIFLQLGNVTIRLFPQFNSKKLRCRRSRRRTCTGPRCRRRPGKWLLSFLKNNCCKNIFWEICLFSPLELTIPTMATDRLALIAYMLTKPRKLMATKVWRAPHRSRFRFKKMNRRIT